LSTQNNIEAPLPPPAGVRSAYFIRLYPPRYGKQASYRQASTVEHGTYTRNINTMKSFKMTTT